MKITLSAHEIVKILAQFCADKYSLGDGDYSVNLFVDIRGEKKEFGAHIIRKEEKDDD